MRLFYYYQIKEYLYHTIIIFCLLLLFIGTIRATLIFTELSQFQLSLFDIIIIFLTSIGEISAFSLLFSGYLSILFVVQRMKYEREILALFSLGYSLKHFLKVIFLFSFKIFFLLLFLTMVVVPLSKRLQKDLKINLYKGLMESSIPERTPFPIGDTLVLYAKRTLENGSTRLYDTLVLEDTQEKKGIYFAKSGVLALKQGMLALEKGNAFFKEANGSIEVMEFKYYEISFDTEELKKEDFYIKRGEMTLSELKEIIQKEKDKRKIYRYMTELYGRIFYPLTSLFLLTQAFFLGLIIYAPQRTLLFIIGSLFYLLFFGFYNFCTSFSETGKFHPLVGFFLFFISISLVIWISYVYIKKKGATYL
ncbi:MAG: LptF/LptG family permease [Thermodesulfobacterium sp.]|nr:LptF/LptG family permease [Thermodesulfobacterium sp.]